MKAILLLAILILAGCQATPRVIKPLPDPLPLHAKPGNYAGQVRATITTQEAAPPKIPPVAEDEQLNRQAQLIEALIAQNDALTARLKALEHQVTPPDSAASSATTAVAVPPSVSFPVTPPPLSPTPTIASSAAPFPAAPEYPTFLPNADGVIDVTALDATSPDGLPNPFAVRARPADAARELTLRVQGIVTGEKPCALVNERVVECGQTVETLRLTQLRSDTLVLSGDRFTLNLPLGATKVRFF